MRLFTHCIPQRNCGENGISLNSFSASSFCSFFQATLHKARLTALHAICLLIFRHIAQKSLARHKVWCYTKKVDKVKEK